MILIIEDSDDVRYSYGAWLEEAGYEIIGEAIDGEEGLKKYKELKSDIVLMDITLPKMSGLDCLDTILEFDKNAKIILNSARDTDEVINKELCDKIVGYVGKTFLEEKFIQNFNKLIETI